MYSRSNTILPEKQKVQRLVNKKVIYIVTRNQIMYSHRYRNTLNLYSNRHKVFILFGFYQTLKYDINVIICYSAVTKL